MKTLIINLFAIVIFLTSCTSPKYLPKLDNYWKGAHGAFIKVTNNNYSIVKGELISADFNSLLVLTRHNDSLKLITVQRKDIKRFWVKHIKAPQYGWSIPLYTLSSLTHGFYMIFTLPLNLISTIVITVSENKKYTYNNKNLAYEDLKMFARFPQGIPENINLEEIK